MSRIRAIRSFFAFAFAFGASASVATIAFADPLDTATPAPAWTKTIGTLRVEKFGAGDSPLILVPGLACGSWVFRDTIAREAAKHTIYAVTLAGFDGTPYDGSADTLDAADASLATLISQENIVKPFLIGHSLGGFLALRFGQEHSELLRGVVSIDGLPVLANLALDTPKQMTQFATGFASLIKTASPAAYRKQELATVRDYVTSPALALKVEALTDRSDRTAVADYGRALFSSDVRPHMASLTAPTLVLAPVPSLPIPSYYPVQLSRGDAASRAEDITDIYTRLTAGAPSLTVLTIQKSRHFVMLDRPNEYAAALDAFIAAH